MSHTPAACGLLRLAGISALVRVRNPKLRPLVLLGTPAGFQPDRSDATACSWNKLHLAPSTINQHLASVRRLAYEASDAGLLSPELGAGIKRVKSAKHLGVRAFSEATALFSTVWKTSRIRAGDNRFPFGIQAARRGGDQHEDPARDLNFPALISVVLGEYPSKDRSMDEMRTILELALRVLSTISVQRNGADRGDVEELRKLAPGHLANESTSELACGVIQEALRQHRAKAAGKAVGVEGQVSR